MKSIMGYYCTMLNTIMIVEGFESKPIAFWSTLLWTICYLSQQVKPMDN